MTELKIFTCYTFCLYMTGFFVGEVVLSCVGVAWQCQTWIFLFCQQVARFALTGDSSLYILLPRSHTAADLQQVEDKMTDAAVLQMIEQMKTTNPQTIEVTLPKIKLDVQPDMNILIKQLGLSFFILPSSHIHNKHIMISALRFTYFKTVRAVVGIYQYMVYFQRTFKKRWVGLGIKV